MSEAKHTPGPWDVHDFTVVVSHQTRTQIASVNGRDAQERAANARFIVQACNSHEAEGRP